MRLHRHEFIRRFLMHVLPKGFHRIRHYGLFANANRAENIATARALLGSRALACRIGPIVTQGTSEPRFAHAGRASEIMPKNSLLTF